MFFVHRNQAGTVSRLEKISYKKKQWRPPSKKKKERKKKPVSRPKNSVCTVPLDQ
jgi:hypothetical protein